MNVFNYKGSKMINKNGFIEYLQCILENIDNEMIKGIARLAIDGGVKALSDKQQYVLMEGIADYIMNECPNCGASIQYEDMAIALSEGMCYECTNNWNRMKEE